MKNIRLITKGIFILFFIGLFSCEKDEEFTAVEFSEIIDLTSESRVNGLTDELGVYTNSLKLHNSNINIRSTVRRYGDQALSYTGRVVAWYFNDFSNELVVADGGQYYIDNHELSFNGNNYSFADFNTPSLASEFVKNNVLGNNITIKNVRNGEIIVNETFYVPSVLYLDGLAEYKIEGANLVRLNREAFKLNFNRDLNNENGILIKLFYRGKRYGMTLGDFENTGDNATIFRAIHIKEEPNNGQITIPSEFFDGIPSAGIITLYVGRGNGKHINIQGESHFYRALAQQQLSVVLD